MKHTCSQWIAAASAILLIAPASEAARRPRYGGELRIEVPAELGAAPDATEPSMGSSAKALRTALLNQVFETLVRIDERGKPQPWLATEWTHDASHKHWVFSTRPNVILHNGSIWEPPGDAVSVADRKPIAEILRDLSEPASAIAVREPNGTVAGTGPFRIARWEDRRTVRLEAHEQYWRGRPYLDAVEIRTVREARERLIDLELARSDVAEVEVTDVRRLQQAGTPVEISRPADVLALVFDNSRIAAPAREALALSIDRPTIQRVLLDRQGDISGALLPQWLSGYGFLFRVERDLARARNLVRKETELVFHYDLENPMMRAIGERIAVNAGEAGFVLRYGSGACDVSLRRLPLESFDPYQALKGFARMLDVSIPESGSAYEVESALLKDYRVIPLFHLPAVYALRGNVRNWTAEWRLDDVWLDLPRTQ